MMMEDLGVVQNVIAICTGITTSSVPNASLHVETCLDVNKSFGSHVTDAVACRREKGCRLEATPTRALFKANLHENETCETYLHGAEKCSSPLGV